MELWFVVAALTSAALHATWNAAIKSSPDPRTAMTGQMVASALLGLPVLVWTGLPALPSWAWIGAATAINIVSITGLLRAYALAGFGMVYPLVRALSVLCVVPLATILTGETLTIYGIIGVGMISTALMFLAVANRGVGALPLQAIGWIALSGACTAMAVMCEAQGVRRSGDALAYGCTSAITNAIAMLWWQKALGDPFGAVRRQAARVIPAATLAMISYLLILWVWANAKVASGAALRDTSALFAILIAVLWLKEPITPLRIAAIVIAALAVPVLRFA